MNKIPEFSIVTVCFNSEKTIKKTIESVLQQEFKDYEYIIVDGASKDGTMDVVKNYEDKFEGRLRYISEPDKGIYDAFNKGIRMSKGKYVWIVNSDDYIEPNALEELYKVSSFMKIVYLLIYILFFLIDDLVIFIVAMKTLEVSGVTTKYNKYSHLVGGILMIIIGLLLIFKPQWIMFNF